MKCLWLLCLVYCNIELICGKPITTDVFLFNFCPNQETKGKNNKGRVTFNEAGSITMSQKLVNVPIKIDYCMDLTDVRVEVDNPVGPPVVTLDRELLVVTVKYRRKQPSKSTYLISAKTVPIKNCKQ